MRVIETSLEEDLSLFSRYLWQQRIRHRIFEERGRQIVEVGDAAARDGVRNAYQAWRSGSLVLEQVPADRPLDEPWLTRVLELLRRFPVLIGVALAALIVYPFSAPVADGQLTTVAGWLTIVDLQTAAGVDPGSALLTGQPWRLFTPMLLHFSVVHLLFNLAVTVDFGRRIEIGRGSIRFGLLLLVIGALSNVGQYLLAENPLFGGLSGVAYGLLGYVLVSQRRFPAEIAWQIHPGFAISLILFLVIFSTGITEPFGLYVANGAHWIGLISGALLALLVPLPGRRAPGIGKFPG